MDHDERCGCCGATAPSGCKCDVQLVDDSDPSVGYHASVWFCFTHDRKAE